MKIQRTILALAAAAALFAQSGDPDVMLQRAIRKETIEGDLKGAIDLYRRVAAEAGSNRSAAAKALLRLGDCQQKEGDKQARRAYERLVNEFGDQTEFARMAQARLAALGRAGATPAGIIAERIGTEHLGLGRRVMPDGRFLPFVDLTTGRNIALRNLQTGEVKMLTTGGLRDGSPLYQGVPVPSRDGKRLAYVWPVGEHNVELRTMNIDGSGVRTLTKVSPAMHPWDWSPDGARIAVAIFADSPTPFRGIAVVDASSGHEHRLRKTVNGIRDIDMGAFSPDGRWIVYARNVYTKRPDARPDWDIFAIDARTGEENLVVTGAGEDREPMWLPGTDRIVFRSDRSGKNGVWMVRIQDGRATGEPSLLKPDSGDYRALGVSRDRSLFYTLSHVTRDMYQATVDPETLRIQDSPAKIVDTFVGQNQRPVWAPAGDAFAYFSTRGGVARLVVRSSDGRETLAAQPLQSTFDRPTWCGSGATLVAKSTPGWLGEQRFDAQDR